MEAKEILVARTDHAIRFLFKNFLNMLEEIHKEHNNNYDKLYSSLPEEYHDIVDMSDYLDDAKFNIYRKRVLDIGNEILRNHLEDVDIFEISFIFKEEE